MKFNKPLTAKDFMYKETMHISGTLFVRVTQNKLFGTGLQNSS